MKKTVTPVFHSIDIHTLKQWWTEHSRTEHALSIKYLAECDSTNVQLYASPHHTNTLLVAERQTQGRGQFEREWQSRQGDLIFSLGLRLTTTQLSALTVRVGLAIAQQLQALHHTVHLKWPNDIILSLTHHQTQHTSQGKLAGILVQTQIQPNADTPHPSNWVVVGVGLNLASRHDLSRPITKRSSAQPIAAHFSAYAPIGLAQTSTMWQAPPLGAREQLLMQLVDAILLNIDNSPHQTSQELCTQWNAFDLWHNRAIVWIDPFGQKHHGTGQGINPDGSYHMLSAQGSVHILSGHIRSASDFPDTLTP